MQVGHFTWNVLHFQCMYLRFGIHRSGMGPIQIGNFYPCNLWVREETNKKYDMKMRDAWAWVEKRENVLQQYICCWNFKKLLGAKVN